jgi:branched-chain amino acid aminotransferase
MAILYINNNGKLLKNEGATIETGNRGHLYGDGLFESVRMVNGKPISLEAHILRMIEGAAALKMRIPAYFSTAFFETKIKELAEASAIRNGGRVRISLDRVSGGTYKPISNEVCYFIEIYPLEENKYLLNEKGYEIDLFTSMRKHKNKLSNFKTKNGLIYVMCAIEAMEKGLDDLLITDQKGSILEGSSSNLFIVSNGVLYTPSLSEGCLGGVMRMRIINTALENKVKVYESSIMPQHLLTADEIFLTNAIKGITWVSGYRTKRYGNEMAKRLLSFLNNELNV